MKMNLKNLAIGLLVGGMFLTNTTSILAAEKIVLKDDNGDPNILTDTLSFDGVISQTQLNEYNTIYTLEKGATLSILAPDIGFWLSAADIVDSEIQYKEVPDTFWDGVLEENFKITGDVYSMEGESLGLKEFATVEEALEGGADMYSYSVGSTFKFIQPGTYSFSYSWGPAYKGESILKVVDTTDHSTEVTTPEVTIPEATAYYTASSMILNNKPVSLDAYTINDNNYIKLRDFAALVNGSEKQFEVVWSPEKGAIELLSQTPYTVAGGELTKGTASNEVAISSTSSIYKDGAIIDLTAYTINNNNHFKLRDLAKAFNIGLTWNPESNTIELNTAIDYQE